MRIVPNIKLASFKGNNKQKIFILKGYILLWVDFIKIESLLRRKGVYLYKKLTNFKNNSLTVTVTCDCEVDTMKRKRTLDYLGWIILTHLFGIWFVYPLLFTSSIPRQNSKKIVSKWKNDSFTFFWNVLFFWFNLLPI